VERRLAAILAADVVGYSRLMGEDEAGTLERLKSLRRELVQPKIAEGRGRIVKLMGDGLLAEFPSVVEAVQCAVDIQQDMAAREVGLPDERRIRLRIGVNLGDIIVEGSDIYGDGVNVAARLEGLAEPGGICISGKVYEEVRNKLPTAFEDLGEQQVKNIAEPVRVYRWTDAAADPTPGTAGAEGALPLPDKPSIAVLPFNNMSGDPEQDYFSDGITEDIITELSRFRSLFVIARNSAFTYKGRAVDVRDVGRELGVSYAVEGSVRKAGNRVRVTVQLIDTETGNHLWAERYDRDLEDVFAVQDEITRTIAGTLGGRLEAAGQQKALRLTKDNLAAYDLYLRGRAYVFDFVKESNAKARACLEQAIELDPSNAQAHGQLAMSHFFDWMAFWVADREASLQKAYDHARQAVRLDEDDGRARWQLGEILWFRREYEEARHHYEKALRLNPNDAEGLSSYGLFLAAVGEPEEGLRQFVEVARLDPFDPSWRHWLNGIVFFTARHYEEALACFLKVQDPINEVRGWLAASYAYVGRPADAAQYLQDFLDHAERDMERFPGPRLKDWEPYWRAAMEYRNQDDFEHLLEGLRKAGLAE
jgi:adenylate cyclase